MKKEVLCYVVAEPQNKGDFRPVVLEYGVDLITAQKVVRKYINDFGLLYKVGRTKYPAFVRIRRVSEHLPKNYLMLKARVENG